MKGYWIAPIEPWYADIVYRSGIGNGQHHVEYAVNNSILLSICNLRLQGPRKFRDRFVGPFKVTEYIDNTAHCLDLAGH